MVQTLADRIKARLAAVGKSAASASIEAGLGRSAVQNILRGSSESPRLLTLQRLTGPLECTLEYLTGQSDVPTLPKRFNGGAPPLSFFEGRGIAAGVFRIDDERVELPDMHRVVISDVRYPGWRPWPYVMLDASMTEIGFHIGDVISVMAPDEPEIEIELEDGMFIVCRLSLKDRRLSELSVRQVELGENILRLLIGPGLDDNQDQSHTEIIVPLRNLDERSTASGPNVYFTDNGDAVSVVGVVTSLYRKLPTTRV